MTWHSQTFWCVMLYIVIHCVMFITKYSQYVSIDDCLTLVLSSIPLWYYGELWHLSMLHLAISAKSGDLATMSFSTMFKNQLFLLGHHKRNILTTGYSQLGSVHKWRHQNMGEGDLQKMTTRWKGGGRVFEKGDKSMNKSMEDQTRN